MGIEHKGSKFLSPDEHKKKILEWESVAHEHEEKGYRYRAVRVEGEGGQHAIEEMHGRSFIDEIKKRLADQDAQGVQEKIRVLDCGGGAALYAAQIREIFDKRVDIYTTGLKKSTAKNTRDMLAKEIEVPQLISRLAAKPLHKHDLKWRSVEELRDFPEFDFIIDTFGEKNYTWTDKMEHLKTIVSKLKPGGMASIIPLGEFGEDPQVVLEKIKQVFGENPQVEVVAERGCTRLILRKK